MVVTTVHYEIVTSNDIQPGLASSHLGSDELQDVNLSYLREFFKTTRFFTPWSHYRMYILVTMKKCSRNYAKMFS
jgi:hypothetical protein